VQILVISFAGSPRVFNILRCVEFAEMQQESLAMADAQA